ncbi:PAS domain S-box protein [Tenacibaculum maritimum]|uniref:PAS domain-containing sensor histidine kinase n=1 Tax=Tenacibaculum maritimum TaxID=107401 RepID=UPI0023077CD3|nr:PAS domain S-box protein [Tenacibaculum maritimum]MDB0603046.1 PAS domain S-box protein [Tenacibaculum maritimum]MDB0611618.1 PAS domain S-box protein [Tenacibaculum maritimum]
MSSSEIEILQRALKREKAARKAAEKILEDKSRELYTLSEELKETNLKLEDLLNKKSSQLQGVFENILDAYLMIDLSGNVLKMNDAAIDLFGYDIAKEGLNVMNLIYPEDAEYAFESFEKLKKAGIFSNYIARIVTKRNRIKWVHINASLVYDRKQKTVAAQGIIRNITELKRTSEAMEAQKKELDIIVQNSSLGIALTQFGGILRTNKSFQELLGYSEEELERLTIEDISLPEDLPESKIYLEKMDSGEIDNFVINKRYRRKNNSILWAKTSVNAVRDRSGNIQCQVALVEDVTFERERSLIIHMINDLAKSILGKVNIYEIAWEVAQKIANYLDTEDCVIYLVDYRRKTLEQIAAFGSKTNEQKEIINKISLPIESGIVGHVVKTGKGEIVNDTSKDSRYIVDDQVRLSELAVPIISEGKVIGVIDSEHIDKNYFTKEHLQTIENIASLISMQLKSALNIREREKAEIRNIQLLKKLEKSNDELNEYAHIVSHDLKSPLRSVYALTSWIKSDNEGKFDEMTLSNFNLIEETLEKMEQLISDVLTYSSIDTVVEKQKVDLNEVLENLQKILFIPENISIKIVKKMPVVNGEITKFQQLFQNLISNAIKFNDKEKGIIQVDFIENKSFYQFSIQDNGIGIEQKYHDKIFKIFHFLKESSESTGIGLSIVKKIIDLYDGEIWLDSKLNEGTTFYFTIKK